MKKQFYLDDGPPTKKCCLIGDNLVYATEDDCLVVFAYSFFVTVAREYYKSSLFIIISYE